MPKAARSVFATVFARSSGTARALIAGAAALTFAGRLAIVAATLELARGATTESAVLGAAGAGAFVAQRLVRAVLRVRAETDLYAASARALLDGDVVAAPRSELSMLVLDGVYYVRQILADVVPLLVGDAIAAIVVAPMLLVLSASSPRVAAVAFAALVAVGVVLAAVRGATRRLQNDAREALQALVDRVAVIAGGRLEIVAHGAEAERMLELDGAIEAYRKRAYRALVGVALLGRAPLVAGAVAAGAFLAIDAAARDAVIPLVLAQALVLAAAVPIFVSVAVGAHELARSSVLLAPLAEVLSSPSRPELGRRAASAPSLPAAMRAQAVDYAYAPAGRTVLDGIDAIFEPGSAAVITGPNGAGKSTLLRLLLALSRPTGGRIVVGEHDLADVDVASLRRRAAYLPQRPYLGAEQATVRDAMRIFDGGASDAAILRALARVELEASLRERAKDPLGVPVGELSAGQRQRVALARVLLRDTPIVLLDEPDANLDRDGVALAARLVRELAAEGKTVAVAAHTPDLADDAATRITLPRAP